jgi:ribosomal protein S12 methylthiotransferase
MVQQIRNALPDVALRTTLIAGFPSESRQQAASLQRFVEDADFDYAGVFVYSPEDGTLAGERADQIPVRTRRARAQRLRDAADQAGFARAARRIGATYKVLLCGQDEQGVWGRTQQMAPEVDGVVYVDGAGADDIGNIVEAKITDSACYDLFADVAKGSK